MAHEIAHQIPELRHQQASAHAAMLLRQQSIWEQATEQLRSLPDPPNIHIGYGAMRAEWEFPQRDISGDDGMSSTVRPRAVAELSLDAITAWLRPVEQQSLPRALDGERVSPHRIQGFNGVEAGLRGRSYLYDRPGLARHIGTGMLARAEVGLTIATTRTPEEAVVLRHPDTYRLAPRDAMYLGSDHTILHELVAEQPLGKRRSITADDVRSLLEEHVPTQLSPEYDAWPEVWASIKPVSAAG